MAVAAIDFMTVLVGDDLCHRKRYPHSVIKRFCGENNTVFKPFEAHGIFQILVYIEHITVVYHQIQLVSRSILNYEMIDYLKAFMLLGNSS